MEPVVKIFDTPEEVAGSLAVDIVSLINRKIAKGGFFSIAVSGGNTPRQLFLRLAEIGGNSLNWKKIHFFWVDERCVPPNDRESNFGMTREILLDRVRIPVCNVHRIRGEDEPEQEANRYSDELMECLPGRNGTPCFGLVLLGLGEDGHTASIFPGNEDLFKSEKLATATTHPVTRQKRITLTGRIINNSESIIFMVTGKNKSGVINEILNSGGDGRSLPASFIKPLSGKLSWYIDREAGQYLVTGPN